MWKRLNASVPENPNCFIILFYQPPYSLSDLRLHKGWVSSMIENMVPVAHVDDEPKVSGHLGKARTFLRVFHSGVHLDFKSLLVDGVQPFLVALVLLSRHEDDVLAFVVAMERALVS